jgi:D-glycerate 3-kinase
MGPQHFDLLVHLDTTDLVNLYKWRMEQESGFRNTKGTGMNDDQVVDFSKSNISDYIYREMLITLFPEVQGYMPAYELYFRFFHRIFQKRN